MSAKVGGVVERPFQFYDRASIPACKNETIQTNRFLKEADEMFDIGCIHREHTYM